jgi:large subunit ribosomal protein L4
MLSTKIYNEKGEAIKDLKLEPKIFDVKISPTLIHQVAVAMTNNQRQVLAHVKDKGQVRGGGIKPWRQKGTGRARHGSSRSPLWSGGGVTFGPSADRNFTQKINKKMRRQALLMALSDKVKNENFKVIDKFEIVDFKTKKVLEILKNLDLKASILIVNDKLDNKFIKSVSNIPKVDIIEARNLNLLEVARYEKMLISVGAIETLEKLFAKKTLKVVVKKEKVETEKKTAAVKTTTKAKKSAV